MTDKIKRDARARAAATGEPYTRALLLPSSISGGFSFQPYLLF